MENSNKDMENFAKDAEEAFQNYDSKAASFIVDDMVVRLVKQGYPREELITVLEKIYNKFEEGGAKKAADYIMDIMCALSGFISPEFRI
jgi:hypothetical protein